MQGSYLNLKHITQIIHRDPSWSIIHRDPSSIVIHHPSWSIVIHHPSWSIVIHHPSWSIVIHHPSSIVIHRDPSSPTSLFLIWAVIPGNPSKYSMMTLLCPPTMSNNPFQISFATSLFSSFLMEGIRIVSNFVLSSSISFLWFIMLFLLMMANELADVFFLLMMICCSFWLTMIGWWSLLYPMRLLAYVWT